MYVLILLQLFAFLNHHYQHYNQSCLFVAEAESRCQGSTGNCHFSVWRVVCVFHCHFLLCRQQQPRCGRFPVINGTFKKWRNWNKPPILQRGKICTYPILQNEDLIRFVTYFEFFSLNKWPQQQKEQKQRIHPFFVVKKTQIHPARFTGLPDRGLGWVVQWSLGKVEVVFPKTKPPVFPMGGKICEMLWFLISENLFNRTQNI